MNTTAEQFMTAHGIKGSVHTRNGSRIYVESVRGRVYVADTPHTTQLAHIDLHTYTAHCRTEGVAPYEAKRRSEQVIAKLAPVARLARMLKVTADGNPVPTTQAKQVYAKLHEAGVRCVIERSGILLDTDQLSRICGTPLIPSRTCFQVRLTPAKGNPIWNSFFTTPQGFKEGCRCNMFNWLELNTVPLKRECDARILVELDRTAEELLASLFGTTWTNRD